MKKITFAFLPFLFVGFILPTDNCRQNTPANIEKTIFEQQSDGPYVSYWGDKIHVKYIVEENGKQKVKEEKFTLAQKASISLSVLTDEPGKFFTVKLKSELKTEKNEYSTKINKQFIVSDIEGNFKAFRKLLQAGNVIDHQFNWTFGDGHLVLTGDFVDRGDQQTEVLWLIYSLEEKAKAAGGHVHYILGNHEIMNMNGDLRYLNNKYVDNATMLFEDFNILYGENYEMGRWLRTKSVIEQVGDVLFCHAGISTAVIKMDVSVSKINKLVRPYYDENNLENLDSEADILYSDDGPFWYRGYYFGTKRATINQVDSTLSSYKVKHIVTGHTVVSDTISVLYNGKVFNTDVHHAKGHSEALVIEGGNYFRLSQSGDKKLIFQK